MKSKINILEFLSPTDWLIFAIMQLLIFAAIIYANKKKNSQDKSALDYLIMGRQLSLPLFVASMVATWYGGIFGVTQISFNYGIYNFVSQGLFWYASYIIFAFVIVKKVAHYQAISLPELVGKMYGPKAGQLSAYLNFFNALPIAYAISIGILIQALSGFSLSISIAIGVIFVCTYSLYGGFRAIVYSELVQFLNMCTAVFLVCYFSYQSFGGLDFLKQNLPASHFDPTGGYSHLQLWVWGLIAMSSLVDPAFYQRIFAANDPKIAKKGILICTLIWCLFDICTTLGALYAKAVIPAAEAKDAYLFYALQLLPDGFRGFFLAGIVATILSTLDSYLFIAANTLSYDLKWKFLKNQKLQHMLSFAIVAAICIFIANYFDSDIRHVWKTLGSYWAACLLVPIFSGFYFKKRLPEMYFIRSVVLSALFCTLWRYSSRQGIYQEIDEIYIGLLTSLLVFLFYYFSTAHVKNNQ